METGLFLVRALAVIWVLLPATALARRTVTVAAASSLEPALSDLARAFESARPDVGVVSTFGASGTFFAQIANGAPFDLLMAADVETPRRLAAEGLGESEVVYAHGSLVLWVSDSARSLPWQEGLAPLASPAVRRIAVANPATAPYGRAALAALRAAGLGAAVEKKLVVGESALQSVQFARAGAVDAALVPRSLASPEKLPTGRVLPVPGAAAHRVEYAAVVLSRARDPSAARAFLAFVAGREGKAILASHGLDP